MSPRLRKAERREFILSDLKLSPHVRISELAERFGVSTETVRRDLDALSSEGLVSRSYGGAAAAPMGVQPPFGERNQAHIEQRERVGRRAASLVKPGEVLMIDAGSTTNQFARALAITGRQLTVLTNSLPIAASLGQNQSIDVILCPGDYMPQEAAVYGDETEAFLSRYHADRAFLGAGGITADGIMDVNRAASSVKRRMLRQSKESCLLIDRSKYDVRLVSIVAPLSALSSLVTDAAPDEALHKVLAASDVAIHVAGER